MMQGTCIYCGQTKLVDTTSQTEADTTATMECQCEEAKRERRVMQLDKAIEELFGEKNVDRRFDAASEFEKETIKNIARTVLCNGSKKGSIMLFDGTKATVARKSNGDISIQRNLTVNLEILC